MKSINHLVLASHDLEALRSAYQALGFTVKQRGSLSESATRSFSFKAAISNCCRLQVMFQSTAPDIFPSVHSIATTSLATKGFRWWCSIHRMLVPTSRPGARLDCKPMSPLISQKWQRCTTEKR